MKKVYKKILAAGSIGLDTFILGWIVLWSYHNINLSDSRWLVDIGATALLMFAAFMYASRWTGRLYKKPLYDQLSLDEREQVRQEYYDERHDGYLRREEETQARERTHKEKEKRDAEEAIRLLYEHMPERVQLRSTILHHELQELGEYDDQEIAGTEQLTRIRAPIPKFSSAEQNLLWSMSRRIADAIIDLAIENHVAELGEVSPESPALYKYRWRLRKEVQKDAEAHLTNLDRYYYTPATPMWRAEDFKRYASEQD
jgi:hypothetical protein